MRLPTGEQCDLNAEVLVEVDGEEKTGYACWYPSMGGYVGKAVIVGGPGCFDVFVWHDGNFPFVGDDPTHLHHCDAEQFIWFGKTALRLLG